MCWYALDSCCKRTSLKNSIAIITVMYYSIGVISYSGNIFEPIFGSGIPFWWLCEIGMFGSSPSRFPLQLLSSQMILDLSYILFLLLPLIGVFGTLMLLWVSILSVYTLEMYYCYCLWCVKQMKKLWSLLSITKITNVCFTRSYTLMYGYYNKPKSVMKSSNYKTSHIDENKY